MPTVEFEGQTHVFPDDFTDADIQQALSGIAAPNAGLASAARPAEMQESLAPKLAQSGIQSLPVAAGLAGAVIGAPVAGYGALAGAGLGAAGGETARQWLMNKIFGQGSAPSPISKQGLTQTAIAGGIGAAAEAPGALVNAIGGRALQGIERSIPRPQTGSAIPALQEAAPIATSAQGIKQSLATSQQAAEQELSRALQGSSGTLKISDLIANARTQAAQAPVKNAVAKLDKIIESAKFNAGITGDEVTAQQLVRLQKEISQKAYTGNPGPVQKVLQNLLQNAYGGMGQGVRQLAPGADIPLAKLTNLYAAKAGVQKFGLSRIQAMAASAALHPRTTALASPIFTGAAIAGFENPRQTMVEAGREILP